MGKIISFFAVLIIGIFVWQGFYLYTAINAPLKINESVVRAFLAENNIPIQSIDSIEYYHGTEAYHIVRALNNDDDQVIIWVPYSLDDYLIKQKDEGLTINEVMSFIHNELNPKEIISVKIGMEASIPLYEITYKDQQDRLSYHYIRFTDGTYLKHYHLKV